MSNIVLTFGPYTGETIESVASTAEGLAYLKWLRDKRRLERSESDLGELDTALNEVTR